MKENEPTARRNDLTNMIDPSHQAQDIMENTNIFKKKRRVIQDSTELGSNCDLSNNPLFGNPNIAELKCTKNGLYSFSTIPNNTLTASKFVPSIRDMTFDLFAVMRLIISAMAITLVTSKTPFRRELKKKMVKTITEETSRIRQ